MQLLALVLLAMLLMPVWVCAAPVVKVSEAPPSPARPVDATAPWVASGDQTWSRGEPTFRLAHEDGQHLADGWLAVTTEAILLRVIVADEQHEQNKIEGDIWDGDGLQIGLDAAGQAAPNESPDAQYVGPHAAAIAFALTKNGPEAFAHQHGRSGAEGPMPRLAPRINRDEQAGTTTYDLRLPWEEFNAECGVWPAFTIAVQVNDMDGGARRAAHWGDGAGGGMRPNRFMRVLIGPPQGEWVGLRPTRQRLFMRGDAVEVAVGIASPRRDLRIEVTSPNQPPQAVAMAPADQAAGGIVHHTLRISTGDVPAEPLPVAVRVVEAGGGEVLAEEQITLTDAGGPIRALRAKLEELAAAAPDALLARHYLSLAALFEVEWLTTLRVFDQDSQPAADCADFAARVLERLNEDQSSFTWDVYRGGRRSLVLAFRSPTDSTLQFYALTLPRDFDAQKTYPLIVYLHGRGDPRAMNNIASRFGPLPATQPAYPDDPPCATLEPWGRGNLGYRGIAERDVMESLADVQRTLKVDPERTALSGHSMGGAGAWTLGVLHPDLWNAVAIYAGGSWGAPTGVGLGGNLRGVPVLIWHGDADGAVPVSAGYNNQKELQANGVEPVMRIIPGRGHMMTAEDSAECTHWLVSQPARRRGNEFAFVGLAPEHLSAYGVSMSFDLDLGVTPRFACRINGNTVYLDTSGTRRVWVDLGKDGLGLSGETTIIWNGKQAYSGPATANVALSEEQAREE